MSFVVAGWQEVLAGKVGADDIRFVTASDHSAGLGRLGLSLSLGR
jgi:hypothetical protein